MTDEALVIDGSELVTQPDVLPGIAAATPRRKPWYRDLTVQVIVAAVAGIALGHFAPSVGTAMQPLGDTFVKLIKMVVGPIAFLTIVSGIATVGDLRRVGRIGGYALLYFEVVTTGALILGLLSRTYSGLVTASCAERSVRQPTFRNTRHKAARARS